MDQPGWQAKLPAWSRDALRQRAIPHLRAVPAVDCDPRYGLVSQSTIRAPFLRGMWTFEVTAQRICTIMSLWKYIPPWIVVPNSNQVNHRLWR